MLLRPGGAPRAQGEDDEQLSHLYTSAPTNCRPGRMFGAMDDRSTNAEDVSHVAKIIARHGALSA
jgi:hypothetical protein